MMTIEELYKALKDAVDNGYGEYPVFVRKSGVPEPETKELEFFGLVLKDYGGPGKTANGEIVFTEEEE